MAEITGGIRSILSLPGVYKTVQAVLGAEKARRRLASDFIRPFERASVLDLGCGPGVLRPYLGDVDYVGIDRNPSYIEAARSAFAGCGEFVCADATEAVLAQWSGRFDIVLMVGLLHHLDDVQVEQLLARVKPTLKPSGRLVTFDGCWLTPQHPVARFLIARDRGQNVRTPEQYAALGRAVFGKVATHVRHDLLHVPYTHSILECSP